MGNIIYLDEVTGLNEIDTACDRDTINGELRRLLARAYEEFSDLDNEKMFKLNVFICRAYNLAVEAGF
jgi:hypothetical protein